MASDDEDVPDSGAVFTFGKSRFLDNKFWIRDDAVIHVACGDEHSAVVTENGKLYTFGSNNWGQLGHGNTVQFPSPKLVKRLKPEKVKLVATGRNHTIVSTESGKLFSFGCGGDGQLGHGDCGDSNLPKAIESLEEQQYKMLSCGSDFTAAVTAKGQLYTWGSSTDGQTGQGDEDCVVPTLVQLRGKVAAVSCGYYHMAVAMDDGTLYICGEKNESGKLGLDESQLGDTSRLQKIFINEQVTAVACGGNHTAVVTASGKLFTFGQGDHGQLGHGSSLLQCHTPKQVSSLGNIHVKFVACGEAHTAVLTKHGNLYTCGDGRHGKLGMGEESFSNLFKLEKVTRFDAFTVQTVACGGCHTLVTAVKKCEINNSTDSEAEAEKDILTASVSSTKSLQDAVDGPSGYRGGLASTFPAGGAARNKRRQKNIESLGNSIGGTLPPITKSTLPPLSRTLPALKKEPSDQEKKPVNPLDMSTLPKISHEDQVSDKRKNEKSADKKETKVTKASKKPKDAESSSGISESEEEDDEEEDDDDDGEDMKKKETTAVTKVEQKKDKDSEESMTEEESDSEEEEPAGKNKTAESNKLGKTTVTVTSEKDNKKDKVPSKKEEDDEEEEEESGEDDEESDEEEEDDEDRAEEGEKPGKKLEVVGKKVDVTKVEKKKKDEDEEDEDEESEEEESEEDEEEEDEEGEASKKKDQQKESGKKSEAKEKGKKTDSKKKKETEEESEEDEDDDEEEEEEEEESEADKETKNAEKDKKSGKKTEKKKNKKEKSEDEEDEEDEEDPDKKKADAKKDKKKDKKGKDKGEESEEKDEDEVDEEDKDDKDDKDKADKEEEINKGKKDKKEDGAGKPEAGKKEKKSGICVLL